MPEEKTRYKLGDKLYDIPKSKEQIFLKQYPNAQIQQPTAIANQKFRYNLDGKLYDIPADKKGTFLKQYPNAVEVTDVKKKEETQQFVQQPPPTASTQPFGDYVKSKLEAQFSSQIKDDYSGNMGLLQDLMNNEKSEEYFKEYFSGQTSGSFSTQDATNIIVNNYNNKLIKQDSSNEKLSDMQKNYDSEYNKVLKATTIPNIDREKPISQPTEILQTVSGNNEELNDFANDYINDFAKDNPDRKEYYFARMPLLDDKQRFNEQLTYLGHGYSKIQQDLDIFKARGWDKRYSELVSDIDAYIKTEYENDLQSEISNLETTTSKKYFDLINSGQITREEGKKLYDNEMSKAKKDIMAQLDSNYELNNESLRAEYINNLSDEDKTILLKTETLNDRYQKWQIARNNVYKNLPEKVQEDLASQEAYEKDLQKSLSVFIGIPSGKAGEFTIEDFVKALNTFQGEIGANIWNSLMDNVKGIFEVANIPKGVKEIDFPQSLALEKVSGFFDNYLKLRQSQLPLYNEDGSMNPQRLAGMVASTGTDMALLLFGAGKFTALLKAAGITSNLAYSSSLFATSYVQQHGRYYDMAIQNGLTPEESYEYASKTSSLISLLELVNPNKGIASSLSGAEIQSKMIKETVKDLSSNNITKTIFGQLKEIGMENIQEITQNAAEGISNIYANMHFGLTDRNKFNEDILDANSLKETILVTTLTTGLIGSGNIHGMNRMQAYSEIFSNDMKDAFIKELDLRLENGEIDVNKHTKVIKEFEYFEGVYNKIPNELDNETKGKLLEPISEKDRLEEEMKNADDVFKPDYEEKIEKEKEKIREIVKPKMKTDDSKVEEPKVPISKQVRKEYGGVQDEGTGREKGEAGQLFQTPKEEIINQDISEDKIAEAESLLNEIEQLKGGRNTSELGKKFASLNKQGVFTEQGSKEVVNALKEKQNLFKQKQEELAQEREEIINKEEVSKEKQEEKVSVVEEHLGKSKVDKNVNEMSDEEIDNVYKEAMGLEREFELDENSPRAKTGKGQIRFRLYPPNKVKEDTYTWEETDTKGIRELKAEDKETGQQVVQALRFDENISEQEAKQWWNKNKGNYQFYGQETSAKKTPQTTAVEQLSDRKKQKPVDKTKSVLIKLPISFVKKNQVKKFAVKRGGENEVEGRIDKSKEFLQQQQETITPSNIAIQENGEIMFGDGRHRLVASEELGAKEIYFEIPATTEQFDKLFKLLNSDSKTKNLVSEKNGVKKIDLGDGNYLYRDANYIYRESDGKLERAVKDTDVFLEYEDKDNILKRDLKEKETETKKQQAKNKISDGLNDFMASIGGIQLAEGQKKPDTLKSLLKIADGVTDLGVASIEDMISKIKNLLSENIRDEKQLEKFKKYVDDNKGELVKLYNQKKQKEETETNPALKDVDTFGLVENEGQWKVTTNIYKGRAIGNWVNGLLDKKQQKEYNKIRDDVDKYGTKEQAEANLKRLQEFEIKNKESFIKAKEQIDNFKQAEEKENKAKENRQKIYDKTANQIYQLKDLDFEKLISLIDKDVKSILEKRFGNKIERKTLFKNRISEDYHKAKEDGSNPELVEAVEKLLGEKPTTQKEQIKEPEIKEKEQEKEQEKEVSVETKKAVDSFTSVMSNVSKRRKDKKFERVKKAKEDFENWIKDNQQFINKLSDPLRTSMLRKVNNIKTEKSLNRAINYFSDILQSSEKRKSLTQRENLLKEIDNLIDIKKYKKAESGVTKGKKIDVTTQDWLRKINKYKELSPAVADEKINKIYENANGRLLTPEEWLEVNALKYPLMQNVLTKDAKNYKETIEEIIANGKTLKEARNKEIVERLNSLKQDVMKNQGFKEGLDVNTSKGIERGMGIINKIARAFSGGLQAHEGWDGIIEILDRTKDFALKKVLSEPIRKARQDYNAGYLKMLNVVKQRRKDLLGNKSSRKYNVAYNIPSLSFKTKGLDGKTRQFNLTPKEVAYTYALLKDETLEKTFQNMGFDFDVVNKIMNEVEKHPELKEYADWVRDEFFPMIYERVNETYREVNDIDLGFTQNYMPIYRADFNTPDSDILSYQNNSASLHHGSLKERRTNKKDIDLHRSIDDIVFDYIMQMEHYRAFAKPLKDITRVLSDKEVKRTIEAKNGKFLNNIIQGFLSDLTRNGIDPAKRNKLVESVRRNFITASLGVNPIVALKQLTSFPAYSADVNTLQFVGEFSKMFATWDRTMKDFKELISTPFIQDRWLSGSFDRDAALSMANSIGRDMKTIKDLPSQLMLFTRLGDLGGILLGGIPYYRIKLKEYLKNNPPDIAKDLAIRDFVEKASTSQQSSYLEDLSYVQRGGTMAQLFTMFKTSQQQYFRKTTSAIRNISRGRATKKDYKNLVMYNVILPALFQYVSGAFDIDDEESQGDIVHAIGTTSLNGTLFAGDILSFLVNYYREKPFTRKGLNLTPAFDRVIKSGMLFSDLVKDFNMEDFVEFMLLNTEVFLGLPAEKIKQLTYDNMDKLVTGNYESVLDFVGYSDYTLEKKRKGKNDLDFKDSDFSKEIEKFKKELESNDNIKEEIKIDESEFDKFKKEFETIK